MSGATIDPARAAIGACLMLPLPDVRRILEVVADTDPDDPRLRVLLVLVRSLADQGRRPDAASVVAYARSTGTVRSSEVTGLALLVSELVAVEGCPIPSAGGVYALALVEHAVRRRIGEAAERLRIAAEESSLDGLAHAVEVEGEAMHSAVGRLATPVILGGAA